MHAAAECKQRASACGVCRREVSPGQLRGSDQNVDNQHHTNVAWRGRLTREGTVVKNVIVSWGRGGWWGRERGGEGRVKAWGAR